MGIASGRTNVAAKGVEQYLLYLFLIACFGGALRKWVVESSAVSNVILGIQMIIPFLMVWMARNKTRSPFPVFPVLYIYFFYLVFHILYPLQLTVYHGLFGLIIHGGFWLGIFFYFANRDKFNMPRLMKWFVIIAAIEIVLAFVQYGLPQDHFINKYAREGQTIAVVGDRVRVTGTFSYLSGFTAFMMFYVLLMWALMRLKWPQWVVMLGIGFGVAVSLMTGSRSIAVIFVILSVPMLLREYPVSKLFSLAGRLIIPVMILVAILSMFEELPVKSEVTKAYENFIHRLETNRESGEQTARLTQDWYDIQYRNWENPLLGVGLGSTYQGSTILFGTSHHVLRFGYVESEITRLLLEGGWILIILRTMLGIIMAMHFTFKGFMRWAILFVVLIGQPIVFNPHNAAFLLLGIILVDNIFWRQTRAKTYQDQVELHRIREKYYDTNPQPQPSDHHL